MQILPRVVEGRRDLAPFGFHVRGLFAGELDVPGRQIVDRRLNDSYIVGDVGQMLAQARPQAFPVSEMCDRPFNDPLILPGRLQAGQQIADQEYGNQGHGVSQQSQHR